MTGLLSEDVELLDRLRGAISGTDRLRLEPAVVGKTGGFALDSESLGGENNEGALDFGCNPVSIFKPNFLDVDDGGGR